MTRLIHWTTRAAKQLQEAATYLEQERKGTGLPFVAQAEAVLQVASIDIEQSVTTSTKVWPQNGEESTYCGLGMAQVRHKNIGRFLANRRPTQHPTPQRILVGPAGLEPATKGL